MDYETNGKPTGINKVVLSDQVKQYILDAIERGELLPGERLIESQLARQFGISQAPVREAIRELVSTGFLIREPHKGTVVRMLTDNDLAEIYSVRATLESLAAQQAVQNISDQQLQLLHEILENLIAMARVGDFISAARFDCQFHTMIIEISGNKLLYRIYQSLQVAQYTLITMRRSQLSLEKLASRHHKILKALQTRDPEMARKAMWQHLEELHPEFHQVVS